MYIILYIYIHLLKNGVKQIDIKWKSIIVPLVVQFGKWLIFNHYHLPVPKNSCNAKSLLKSIINTVQCH